MLENFICIHNKLIDSSLLLFCYLQAKFLSNFNNQVTLPINRKCTIDLYKTLQCYQTKHSPMKLKSLTVIIFDSDKGNTFWGFFASSFFSTLKPVQFQTTVPFTTILTRSLQTATTNLVKQHVLYVHSHFLCFCLLLLMLVFLCFCFSKRTR